jgi:hypothetical protein
VDRVDANSHAPAAPESAAAAADIAATGSPAGVDALTLPGTEVDPTAWQDTACALATDLLPALLKPEQCGDVYVGVLTSVVLGVPTAVLGLVLWLFRRRGCRPLRPRPLMSGTSWAVDGVPGRRRDGSLRYGRRAVRGQLAVDFVQARIDLGRVRARLLAPRCRLADALGDGPAQRIQPSGVSCLPLLGQPQTGAQS